MPADAGNLFREGRLRDAITEQTARVRAAPADVAKRWLLAELLCFAEEWERADRLLDVIALQAAEMAAAALGFRRLLRAEEVRRQVMLDGRAPQIVGTAGDALYPVAEALLCLRNGPPERAAAKLEEVAAATPAMAGIRNGEQRFDVFRDLDDVCAAFVEFITEGGEYHWVSVADLTVLETQPQQRPRDLIWRPARLEIRDGPAGDVYLPALYVAPASDRDDALRLGRRTDWLEQPGAPVRGLGQRMFLVGDDDVPLHELGRLEFLRNGGGP
jgi:type VI secretion system protein ImpE